MQLPYKFQVLEQKGDTMYIQPINTNTQTNFNGRIITKGKWPQKTIEFFNQMPEIVNASKGEYNIVGNMHQKKVPTHPFDDDEIRFKLTITAEKENPTFVDKIKYFLGLTPKLKVTQHHHREHRYPHLLQERLSKRNISKELGIE